MKNLALYLTITSLCGCASVASSLSANSSGILPYKDGNFMVSTMNALAPSAQKQAYKEAIDFCKLKNSEMSVLGTLGERTSDFTLYFYCK